jgi:DnaK suppressor protein
MTKDALNRFQAILTARVSELDRHISDRSGIAIDRSPDQLDEIQGATERALAVFNLDREFNQRRIALAALRRIREGSYGTCLQCDEEIHPKRLAAVPWASFCLGCQEAVDRDLVERQSSDRAFLGNAV